MFDELDDLDVDFDASDVEGRLLAEVKTVEAKRKDNSEEGTTSTGVNVTFVIENDATFEGQWVNQYYWLGTIDTQSKQMVKKPNAGNIKAFRNFVEAVTGVKPEGNIKLSSYSPETRTLGKREGTCLTDLEGAHVMITVAVEKGQDGVERSVVKAVAPYEGGFASEDDEDEPF